MLRKIAVYTAVSMVALAGVALAAASGGYSGKTSQKLAISLKVNHAKITKVRFTARYRGTCGGSGVGGLITTFTGHIAVNKHGTFNAKVRPNSASVLKIKGHFKGRTVKGSFTSSVTEGGIHGSHTCSTAKITFTAKHK